MDINNDKIKPIMQQDFPEVLGDPKINIPHNDAAMDAHDSGGEMVEDSETSENGKSLLG